MAKSARAKKSQDKNDVDYKSEVLSKKEQRKIKKVIQQEKPEEEEEEVDEDDEEDDDDSDIENIESRLDFDALAESEDDEDIISDAEEKEEDEEEDDDEEEDPEAEEDDVPLSDVEIDSDADIVPYTKLTINNVAALKDSLSRIQIPFEKYGFDEHQSITYHSAVEDDIKDIYDDTERELQFFKQGLDAAVEGRKKLLALKIRFSRPMDYFAEMVKSDEHMEKLKVKLMKEATEKKASEESRRQRQLKKFGKQVQHETLQNRQKEKRDALEKIKSLKRKRQSNEIGDDEFNIAVEEAAAAKEETRGRDKRGGKGGNKRQKSDDRFSSKGGERFGKPGGKGSAAKSRPGKNRRRNKKKM
ncbi:hypothetical protein CANARDRAFT_208906 [[Candida] arabinofermentans NRRL YB-2248]|uniref:Uncharacterized protein n=1 Tax=[Candida] arabinofermentans NRRL YB-2248 TaxID=983967 RepID=A0A1E4SW43_9ASCO|nr:hypothetical protein CANARDRAFT_208906 [[Candida] arabinofermentans NRRL YB-2248]